MKIFTFGSSLGDAVDTHYPGAKHGDVPETWVTQAQAKALVDKAMGEKGLFGTPKYASRSDAEKAVIDKLYDKKTGITVSGDLGQPTFTREDRNLSAFFGCAVATMGIGFGITRLRKGL